MYGLQHWRNVLYITQTQISSDYVTCPLLIMFSKSLYKPQNIFFIIYYLINEYILCCCLPEQLAVQTQPLVSSFQNPSTVNRLIWSLGFGLSSENIVLTTQCIKPAVIDFFFSFWSTWSNSSTSWKQHQRYKARKSTGSLKAVASAVVKQLPCPLIQKTESNLVYVIPIWKLYFSNLFSC